MQPPARGSNHRCVYIDQCVRCSGSGVKLIVSISDIFVLPYFLYSHEYRLTRNTVYCAILSDQIVVGCPKGVPISFYNQNVCITFRHIPLFCLDLFEPRHGISNNVVCANKQSLRSACAYAQSDQSLGYSLEYSIAVKLLTEHHFDILSLKGGCTGSSESTFVEMPHCWKSHVTAHFRKT